MKIVTYNINGIRAVLKKNFVTWMKAVNADVICLQEVKAQKDQIDISVFENLGYHFFLHPAVKKGYSGVAILSKEKPRHVEIGIGIERYDTEGRLIRADFSDYSVMSVYMPSGASRAERQDFKLQWLTDFYQHINDLIPLLPNLVIGGDFNICHKAIDIHDPYTLDGYPGFTAEERMWLSSLLNLGFVDAFRCLNHQPHQYSWWSYMSGARSKNLGWRIDYLLLSHALKDSIQKALHLTEAYHSDHCPVVIELDEKRMRG